DEYRGGPARSARDSAESPGPVKDRVEGGSVRTNPFSNAIGFLTHGARWPLSVYWFLLAASVLVAAINWRSDSRHRSAAHLWNYVTRLSMGIMLWSQTLWKLPPTYGDLRYWMEQIVKGAAFPVHADFFRNVALPHFTFFAPQVYAGEVLISVSLMLGCSLASERCWARCRRSISIWDCIDFRPNGRGPMGSRSCCRSCCWCIMPGAVWAL